MKITSDWHIHSRNSCDAAALAVGDLVSEAAARGITEFGLADHIHSLYNLPDLEKSRAEFDAVAGPPTFRFGVEVSSMSRWELEQIADGAVEKPTYGIRQGGPASAPLAIGIGVDELTRLGVEYVVGGTHWPMYVPYERDAIIRDYHRQNMFLATHPLVDIVAHPWWWHGHWRDEEGSFTGKPWFDDFAHIPAAMHDEFAAAAIERDRKVEINIGAMLLNRRYPDRFKRQYLDYLADLKSRGVGLATGSDCHSAHYDTDFETAAGMLQSVGILEVDLWTLAPRGG